MDYKMGAQIEIVKTRFPHHAAMVGKRGIVHNFIKNRGIYQINLENGDRWESLPENIRAIQEIKNNA